jgi:hypothetical protein
MGRRGGIDLFALVCEREVLEYSIQLHGDPARPPKLSGRPARPEAQMPTLPLERGRPGPRLVTHILMVR